MIYALVGATFVFVFCFHFFFFYFKVIWLFSIFRVYVQFFYVYFQFLDLFVCFSLKNLFINNTIISILIKELKHSQKKEIR